MPQVLEAGEVQACAAGLMPVVVDFVAGHADDFSDLVGELPAVDIRVVVADPLVCEEVPVIGDGQVAVFQETHQFFNGVVSGVIHEVANESLHGGDVVAFFPHLNQPPRQGIGDPETVDSQGSVIGLQLLTEVFSELGDLVDFFDGGVVVSFA